MGFLSLNMEPTAISECGFIHAKDACVATHVIQMKKLQMIFYSPMAISGNNQSYFS